MLLSIFCTETFLRRRIQDGTYKYGNRIPAERIICNELNVGRSAVRNALLRLEVQGWVTRKPGCCPIASSPGAQHNRSQIDDAVSALKIKKQIIAVVMPMHPVYGAEQNILVGIQNGLRQQESPHRLLLLDTNALTGSEVYKKEAEALDALELDTVAGAIVWFMGGEQTQASLQRLTNRNFPLVLVDRIPKDVICDFVETDNRSGAHLAVEHLLSLGHRRIAFVTDTDANLIPNRERGYKECLQRHGIAPSPELIFTWSLEKDMPEASAVDYLFSLPHPPTAVFASNDIHAHAFIVQAIRRGMRVPEDISVVGFDDLERYVPHPYPLTTVHQPFHQIGERAVNLLLRRLSSKSLLPCQHVLLPSHLVIGSTTASGE